jgi:hypothetical protein
MLLDFTSKLFKKFGSIGSLYDKEITLYKEFTKVLKTYLKHLENVVKKRSEFYMSHLTPDIVEPLDDLRTIIEN